MRCRLVGQQRLQDLAPARQCHLAQVVPFEERHVEHEIVDLGPGLWGRFVERVLQGIEIGHAVAAEHDDLAVEPARRHAERLDPPHQRRHARRPVVAAARDQPRLAVLDARHEPVAVELDFADPGAGGRHRGRQRGELRQQALRQLGAHGARHAGRGGVRGRCRRCRRRGPGVVGRRLQRVCDDAVRQRRDDVVIGLRARMRVAFLEQQPGFLLLIALGDPDQLPRPGQLLAVQSKRQLAGGQPGTRVADRLPVPAVPDDHAAGAVLLRRDRALERSVRQRMVFHLNGHALVGRIATRALRHRPGQQYAVELQPEVVMQA